MYITYNINTRQIERIDNNKIILNNKNLKMVEKDIELDDEICVNMPIYKVDDNEELYIDDELVAEFKLNNLRMKREPLLKAFDIYKTNLIVGAISLSEDEKQEVITWYNKVLDLDVDAINNPTTVISKYL